MAGLYLTHPFTGNRIGRLLSARTERLAEIQAVEDEIHNDYYLGRLTDEQRRQACRETARMRELFWATEGN